MSANKSVHARHKKIMDEDVFIKKNHRAMTDTEMAKHLGISASTIGKRRKKMGLPPYTKVIENEVLDDARIIVLTKNKNRNDEKYKELLRQYNYLKKDFSAVVDMKNGVHPHKILSRKSSKKSEATAFLIASDWHFGERIKREQINGINEFNLDIAKERADHFFSNSRRLVEIMRKDTSITDVVLVLGGDFISSTIHDDLKENNELGTVSSIIEAQNAIISGIEHLLEDRSIHRLTVACCFGNHGRMTKEKLISAAAENSVEAIMYHTIQDHFREQKRVDCIISKSYHLYLEVYGNTIRIHHGDYVKYNGGIGGVTIPLNKAIAQWNKLQHADLDVLGHFHQSLDGGNFIVNGSLVGYDPYALSIKASAEEPKQVFFLWDKKRKKTVVAPIFLEKK